MTNSRLKKALFLTSLVLSYLNFVAPKIESMQACENELPPEIQALLDPNVIDLEAPVPVQETCFDTVSLLDLLTPPTTPDQGPPAINLVAILENNLYRKTTSPVTRRSLLDEPALLPDPFANDCFTFNAEVFYNYSPLVYLTKHSPFLCSYANFDIIPAATVTDIENLFSVNVADVPSLFSNVKLQQHRAGFLFGFTRQWENWYFHWRIPLYYLLEHFFLTDSEKKAIENNPLFATDPAGMATGPTDEVNRFIFKHLVSDKFGFGDSRLSLLGHLYASDCQNLWAGVQMTIPSAGTLVKALIGAEFNPREPIPPFNLQHYANLFLCPSPFKTIAVNTGTQEAIDFLTDVLDRLSTMVINAPLGNGGHFGIGPELDFRYEYNEYFSMHTYASIEAYFPRTEPRFFLLTKTPADFDRDWRNPDLAGQNLAELNKLVIATLFPVGIQTEVFPGTRFQINQTLLYKNKHWDLKLGFDYWFQGSEHLQPKLPVIPCNLPISVEKAIRPSAQQAKLFATVGYYDRLCNGVDWYLWLNLDGTVFHTGIGQNYTLGLRFGLDL